jgi:hypothetical protein
MSAMKACRARGMRVSGVLLARRVGALMRSAPCLICVLSTQELSLCSFLRPHSKKFVVCYDP